MESEETQDSIFHLSIRYDLTFQCLGAVHTHTRTHARTHTHTHIY